MLSPPHIFSFLNTAASCRGFPVQQFIEDRLGLVLAFWGVGLHLGRPLISQTDYKDDGSIFGSVLNHVTDGRWTNGEHIPPDAVLHKVAIHLQPTKLFERISDDDCCPLCIWLHG